MLKRYLFALLSTCLVVPVWAEWNEESLEVEVADTIVVPAPDTVVVEVNDDPEWYVPPISWDVNFVPRRAVAASTCLTDSLRTFDVDSVLTEVTWYDYDNAGRTIRTTVWTCNPDGSRVGKSKNEVAFDAAGRQVLSATYDWDNTTNDWHGLSRTEDVFNENGKQESRTIYEWVNNDWLDQTLYTYQYDEANREIEFLTYTRAANDIFELSNGRIREYNTAGKTTLDIQYSAYANDEPTAGTKKVYVYSDTNQPIEYTYYSDYSNGSWIGSTHEIWSYDANNQKTSYKKELWSSGAWKINNEEYWTYDSDGNNIGLEKYALKNGSLAGTQKAVYTFLYGSQVQTITYKWVSGDWVYNIKTIEMVDEDDNIIESCSYSWKNEAWVGTGTRTLNTYSSGILIEQTTQKWPTNATDWVNATRSVNKYSGANITHVASYVWENDTWKGVTRKDYHYTSNKNDTVWTFTYDTDWVYLERIVYTYSGSTKIMTHNAAWNGTKWVMTSMERTDIVTENGKTVLNTKWTCSADSVWVGVQRDSTAYSPSSGKQTYTERFTYDTATQSWLHSTKTETDYDSKNRQTDKRVYKWNTSTDSWAGTSRTETVYDEKGNKKLEATYNGWIEATKSWKGNKKTEKTFNDNNLVSSMILSNWSTTTNDWLPTSRYSYEYDGSKREIDQLVENYTNGTWTNANQYIKEYKGSTKVKDNKYTWLNNQRIFTSRNETYYDDDSLAKLRRIITGSWNNKGVVQSFSDILYSYSCDLFTIQFKNYDGTLLSSIEIENGKIPEYTGETPTKPANAQYTYTFKGWDPKVQKVTGNAVYTADFDSIVKHYLIVFKDKDGKIIDGRNWDYGTEPTCAEPAKPANAQYTYSFKEWIPAIEAVTQEATYTADLDSVINQYTIRFVDEDGLTELYAVTLDYGDTPVYGGETPTKPEDDHFTYTFKDWSPEIEPVTAEATYKAEFTATPKVPTAVGNVQTDDVARKVLLNGTLYITREGNIYTISGQKVNR